MVLVRELLTTMRCESRVAVELWRSMKYFWRSKQPRAQSLDLTLTPRSAHLRTHTQSTRFVPLGKREGGHRLEYFVMYEAL